MVTINLLLSIITLNVYGVNSLIIRHWVAESIPSKRDPTMCYLKDTQALGTHLGWKWREEKQYSLQMVTKKEQG